MIKKNWRPWITVFFKDTMYAMPTRLCQGRASRLKTIAIPRLIYIFIHAKLFSTEYAYSVRISGGIVIIPAHDETSFVTQHEAQITNCNRNAPATKPPVGKPMMNQYRLINLTLEIGSVLYPGVQPLTVPGLTYFHLFRRRAAG